ncbi:glycoside hydrolase domain-containing protein [Niallia sp. 01092]|uniref:glycoside hydrolase domain-containing protein n=1 Tax=unclassified Niallia TaxID=2837522 RepID=UPI003FCF299B
MEKGFDCSTKLTEVTARSLKNAGFDYAARYLGNSWKSFDKKEAEVIQVAGLYLISIFQKSANYGAYFTYEQGVADAKEAMEYAYAVEQPKGTAIYFAVDFEADSAHLKDVLQYFSGVKKTLKDYKLGIYGSYTVMHAVKDVADYYWQTYAWSRGQVADFIHMHQYENDVEVNGVTIDRNDIKKSPGHWETAKAVAAVKEGVKSNIVKTNSYHIVTTVNAYMNAADAKAKQNKKGTVPIGDYYIFNESQGMINVTQKKGVPGSWINPSENKKTSPETARYHIVKKGETVTSIANDYKTTIAAIKKLNPDIQNIDLIYVNQKIRVK